MLTKHKVSAAIDAASRAFHTCWESLRTIRTADAQSLVADHILEFQPRLAKAIHDLGEIYRAVKREASETVNRKPTLPSARFKTRMRILRKYEDVLNEAMRVGKSIGDGFAWLFYHREPALLAKHLQHSEVKHPPGGVGGRGERQFVNDVRLVNGHFILYHGVTSILRLGDVSLIDLATFKVTGIGELKSELLDPGRMAINVTLLGPTPKVCEVFQPLYGTAEQPDAALTRQQVDMPPKLQDRLKRQMHAIASSFAPKDKMPEIAVKSDSTIDELRVLCSDLQTDDVAFRRCGRGMLLIGIRQNADSCLSARLLANVGRKDWDFGDLAIHTREIFDQSQPLDDNWNSLMIGVLKPEFMAGTVPIACWPLDDEFIRQMVFQEIFIVSIYNQAFFVGGLKEAGFRVERRGGEFDFNASIPFGGGTATIHGWDYFRSLITHHFMSEEGVLGMIRHFIARMKEDGIAPGTKVEMDISLHM